MGQTKLSSIAMINIERLYAYNILQESMDRITDLFGKRKDRDSICNCFNYFVILC